MNNLFNPFEKYQEKTLLFVGIIGFIISSILANIFNCRMDGLIDIHFIIEIKWYQPILDQLVNVFILTFILFILGKIYNKKTRIIDILNSVLIARIPFIILIFTNYKNYLYNISEDFLKNIQHPVKIQLDNFTMIFLFLTSFLVILIIIWHFVLLWNGFKVATFAKGNKIMISFIIVFIVTHTLSKFIVYTY